MAKRVGETSGQLRSAAHVAGDYRGAAGSGRIDDRLDEFFREWSDAVHMITEDLDGVQARLSAAASSYEKTDCSVIAGATGGGNGTRK